MVRVVCLLSLVAIAVSHEGDPASMLQMKIVRDPVYMAELEASTTDTEGTLKPEVDKTLTTVLRKEQVLWPEPHSGLHGDQEIPAFQLDCSGLGKARSACKRFNKLVTTVKGRHYKRVAARCKSAKGEELGEFKGLKRRECQNMCEETKGCVGFEFEFATGECELHNRVNTKLSLADEDGKCNKESCCFKAKRRRYKPVAARCKSAKGKELGEFRRFNRRECQNMCDETKGCVGFEFEFATGECELHNRVNKKLSLADEDGDCNKESCCFKMRRPKSKLACGEVRAELQYDLDETYKLEVSAKGVNVSAANWVGCVRAITTLTGLVENTAAGNSGNWIVPKAPWKIYDKPAYPYRAIMVDTSRHWYAPKSLRKLINQMAVAKLNVLHLHLTDTGGWSLQVEENGQDELGLANAGIRPGMIYSVADMKALVKYAERRAITVTPELDTPGHAAPQVPEHLVRCTTQDFSTTTYGLEAPVAQYNIGPDQIDATANWFEKVWEHTKDIFPNMPFMHFGADEVNVPCMVHGTNNELKDSSTQEEKDEAKMIVDQWQSEWVRRMQNVATKLQVPAAMWQDGYLNHKAVEVSEGTVLQMWDYNPSNEQHKERLIASCKSGIKLIQSRYRSYYLDCGGANWLFGGDSTWCQEVSWNRIYLEGVSDDLPVECQDNVIGASVQLWSEAINEHNLLTRAFPRAWALAERLWSNEAQYDVPPMDQFWDINNKDGDGKINTGWALNENATKIWLPALDRLRILQNNQDQAGLASKPLQPEACVVHPELCNEYTHSGR